jgi:hypothetical protein
MVVGLHVFGQRFLLREEPCRDQQIRASPERLLRALIRLPRSDNGALLSKRATGKSVIEASGID